MTKEEWIARCAQRFIDVVGLDQDQANEVASNCHQSMMSDGGALSIYATEPEDAADEEMSYWDDDGD